MSPVKGHSFVVETLKTQNYDSICLPYWGTSVPYSKACLAVFRLMTKSIQKQYNTIPHKDLNRQCYYVQNTQVPSHQGYTAQFRQESETKKRSRRSTCLPCNSFPVKGQLRAIHLLEHDGRHGRRTGECCTYMGDSCEHLLMTLVGLSVCEKLAQVD